MQNSQKIKKFDLSKKKRVHFIGIGGISMSAIALILQKNGFYVQGSDFHSNENAEMLMKNGIKVFIGHKKENVTDDIDIVVYSKAIKEDNEEMVSAREKGIEIMSRSKILGEIMCNYDKKICIAGTHGKTTTTALVSKVLLDIGLDPTINVGGIVDEIGGNSHIGEKDNIFVAEACEYTNSFLDFPADIEVITNIEEDHLDFFKDLDDIRKSFKEFINLMPDGGLLVINNRIEDIKYLTNEANIKVVTYGDDETADYYYKNASYDDEYYQCFDVYKNGELKGRMRQRLIGRHNARNFLAAYAVLDSQGIDFEIVKKSLEHFKGARRRLEVKGKLNGVTYIDDYAHHPTEILASVTALSELAHRKLYIIYQPHTFSRTKTLLNGFIEALSKVENVILAKIYPAREKDLGEISSDDIRIGINELKKNRNIKNNICEYLDTFDKIYDYVSKIAVKGDIVVTMGAGDICKLLDKYSFE